MALCRPALLENGIDYLRVADVRAVLRRHMRPEGWRSKLWSTPVRKLFGHDLEKLRTGPGTLLLSEEDLLGYTFDQLAVPFYGRFPSLPLIRALERLGTELKLFLAVRSLDGIIPSAYAQTVRALTPAIATLDRGVDLTALI
ncbi:hypothetical protein [Pseudoruegeria sp. SK021]|uniref:hypothetical protein n=1 Tax=Pseudoruegeria sp. SK021 TaxID=1933035 RepID=UPI000A238EFA|nr:hypothetical protein [Pseudoruegeria sp. SK021]OSP54084.1 hypothetical protein BV911_14445 [Pseudoruegeria sp. SK021]